jgi:hypothetical protein
MGEENAKGGTDREEIIRIRDLTKGELNICRATEATPCGINLNTHKTRSTAHN